MASVSSPKRQRKWPSATTALFSWHATLNMAADQLTAWIIFDDILIKPLVGKGTENKKGNIFSWDTFVKSKNIVVRYILKLEFWGRNLINAKLPLWSRHSINKKLQDNPHIS